jgi:hypothetical protein
MYRGQMPSESYFMTMGGIGVSLAGFAGLIAALDRRPGRWSPVASYRIRAIVVLGFGLAFGCFGTLVLYSATNANLNLTVAMASVLFAFPPVRGLTEARPGPVWTDERQRRLAIAFLVVLLVVALGNVVVGSLAYLQFIVLTALIGPASIFFNTVVDATSEAGPEPQETGALPPDRHP